MMILMMGREKEEEEEDRDCVGRGKVTQIQLSWE